MKITKTKMRGRVDSVTPKKITKRADIGTWSLGAEAMEQLRWMVGRFPIGDGKNATSASEILRVLVSKAYKATKGRK